MADFDMCQFGLRSPSGIAMKKRTRFMTNSQSVYNALNGHFCDGSHEHQPIEGQEGGIKRSASAQTYPDLFVRTVCRAVLYETS